MKQIVAWVNKWDKKQLGKFPNANIYFASSLNDFEAHLISDCIPVFSLVLAALCPWFMLYTLTTNSSDISPR